MSLSPPDIIIVGGGIVGAACADAFSCEGLKVTVLEADIIGGGATAAGMGHIVVMDDSDEQFALTRYGQQLWNELAEEDLPADCEFSRPGTIWAAADEEDMDALRAKHAFYGARSVATEVLAEHALREAEPNLRKGLAGGLLVPGDRVLYPPCAARFLLERSQRQGATVVEHAHVATLTGRSATLSDGTTHSANTVVNATGHLAPALHPGLPVRARKGHLAITDRYPGFLRHQVIEVGYLKSAHGHNKSSTAFNVQPRGNGQLLIGSSRQFGEDDRDVEPGLLAEMLHRATSFLPGLSRFQVLRSWTGFRAATPDSLPLIGPAWDHEGMLLATGHEGLGIATSLASARLLVDQFLGRAPAIPVEPYLPGRLATGSLDG